MVDKRKSGGANPALRATEERQAKRRLLQEQWDLDHVPESRESTTAYGLNFLEQMRNTTDKAGNLVALCFNELPSREEDPEYYEKTRMPISFNTIEAKLKAGEFQNLEELEKYCKRMIANNKEYYPKGSAQYDNAERLRKALSNYMTKTNPAYRRKGGYSAQPTELPSMSPTLPPAVADPEHDDTDAMGEPDEDAEEDDPQPSRKPSVILRSRGPGRPSKGSAVVIKKSAVKSTKVDSEFEGVPYKGLTFQRAQEKIVEEMLRYKDDETDPFFYYELFIELPKASLKDYYETIKEPISIRVLQKMVTGAMQGSSTGTSEFKSWAALEEKASLLWKNAFQYNQDGSDIFKQAEELRAFFHNQLKEAKAAVTEPQQVKIKLKVSAASDPALPARGDSSGRGESLAPLARPQAVAQGANGSTMPAKNGVQPHPIDRAPSGSVSAASPISSIPGGDHKAADPAPAVAAPQQAAASPQEVVQQQPVQPPWLITPLRRSEGLLHAVILGVTLRTPPGVKTDKPIYQDYAALSWDKNPHFAFFVDGDIQGNNYKLQIMPNVPRILGNRHMVRLEVWHNFQPVFPDDRPAGATGPYTFTTQLSDELMNVIEVHALSTIPEEERGGGPEMELEVMTFHIHLSRHYAKP